MRHLRNTRQNVLARLHDLERRLATLEVDTVVGPQRGGRARYLTKASNHRRGQSSRASA